MPIIRVANYVEFYRHLATSSGLNALSGRGSDETAATEFANRRVLEAMELVNGDVLVDVGCGDGSLLEMAGAGCKRIGIVPTVEEQSKLQRNLADMTFLVGRAQRLPLDAESASKIVCNGVLLLLESEEVVRMALKEIARVARPGARIWLGEVPEADELHEFGKYRGSSVTGFLGHQLTKNGLRAFLSSAKTVAVSLLGSQTLVLSAARIFHAKPEKFIAMARECGLRPVTRFKYKRLDRSGEVIESPFRWNYVFEKQS